MGARSFLILGLILLLLIWAGSAGGLLRRASASLRILLAVLFVFCGVRVGLSIAIIAFDLSPISYLIPIAFGLLAWWLRPGRRLGV